MGKTRKSKKNRPPAAIRVILAHNVRVLRDQVFKDEPNETARNIKLAHDAKTTLSQIQRICAAEIGTTVDYVELLSQALKVRPCDLLTPYFQPSAKAVDVRELDLVPFPQGTKKKV